MTERIDIKPVRLKHQKPISVEHCYMELHDAYIRYCVDFEAEEPVDKEDKDLTLGWEPVHTKSDVIILKSQVVGLDMAWSVFNRKWTVYILINASEDLRTYFKEEADAISFRDKILKWLINH